MRGPDPRPQVGLRLRRNVLPVLWSLPVSSDNFLFPLIPSSPDDDPEYDDDFNR